MPNVVKQVPWVQAIAVAGFLLAPGVAAQEDSGDLVSVTAASPDAAETETGPRSKPLQVTVGTPPQRLDIGSEADLAGVSEEEEAAKLEAWSFNMKGYIRAPVRVSVGPRNDRSSGSELHVPPRIVGASSGTWEYIALAPNPALSIYVQVGNPIVSANVQINGNTLYEGGYRNLDQIGGIRQAYLTLKFPNAFGDRGGLAWTVGAFSNRYGSAGPRQVSSGYYGTYLFGRTHNAGQVLTASFDLSPSWELVLEHGFGAKLETVPFVAFGEAFEEDFFQGQGSAPHGSNFLHHAHAGLRLDSLLSLQAHWLTSWTSNDKARVGFPISDQEPRLTAMGAEVHLESETFGSGYIGYARVDGQNLLPLENALQVLHGSDGRGFKFNYFLPKDRVANFTPRNDTGTVDTILFQHIFRLAPFMDLPFGARDLNLALYGMFNHVRSPRTIPDDPLDFDLNYNKFKFGSELLFSLVKYMSVGFRADRVIPDLSDTAGAYTAISPRVVLRTTWKTKEYILMNYTHFFLGPEAYPSSPFSDLTQADADMFMVAAVMPF